MNVDWNSYNGDNTSFWEHEWSKHGTCMNPAVSCDTYFNDALDLFGEANIKSVLANNSIEASNTKSYTAKDIQNSFKTSVNLSCSYVNGKDYLLSVQYCVDLDLEFFNCESPKVSNCGNGENIYLPSV